VSLDGLRRLALGDVDDATVRGLVAHGEHLLVERKQQPPGGTGLGEAVASFANTIGGWLLLGVADDRTIKGWQPPGRADAQAHLGELLREQVDPLPPFVAGERELDGTRVVVVRVFESADTPHIVKPTGAVYIRTSKGKEPVREQGLLLALAQRGEEARRRTMARLGELDVIVESVSGTHGPTPPDGPNSVVVVRAGPLTVTPQFNDWAITGAAAERLTANATSLATSLGITNAETTVVPHGRGIAVHWVGGHHAPVVGVLVIDSGGVVAARLTRTREPGGKFTLGQLKPRFLTPLIEAVAETLGDAEA
jgi:hypothetical protein